MYEVTGKLMDAGKSKGRQHLIPVYSRGITGKESEYRVAAGTDGTMSGTDEDSRTYVRICNPVGSGLFRVKRDLDGDGCGVTITTVGDDDLIGLIKALKFAARVLEEEAQEIDD
jgi:hypothetical protein